MILKLAIEQSGEIDKKINDANLDILEYTGNSYRIRLRTDGIEEKMETLKSLIQSAFDQRNR